MNWFKRLFKKKEVAKVEQRTKRKSLYSSGYRGTHSLENSRNDLLNDPLLSPLSPISHISIWHNNHSNDTPIHHSHSSQDDTPSHSHDSYSHDSGSSFDSSSSSDSSSYDSGSSYDSSSSCSDF